MNGRGRDFFQHVVALDELAERGVLAVEKARVAVADEKLRAGGIRILRARHREDAARVRLVIELRLDLMPRPARAPRAFLARIFRQRITALNHKTLDDAMKTSAVVKTFLREVSEIFDVARRNVRPEFENHFARTGGKDSNFAHINILWFSLVKLFHAVGGNDFNAVNVHAFKRAIRLFRRRGGDFVQHVKALDQIAENGVLAVERTGIGVADKELRAAGIRILRARHRENAARVMLGIKFRVDGITRPAHTPSIFRRIVLRVRIAALNHEAGNDTVKRRAVVKAAARELLKIGNVIRCDVGIKFQDHHAFARRDDSDFFGARCGGRLVGDRRRIRGRGRFLVGATGGEQQGKCAGEK